MKSKQGCGQNLGGGGRITLASHHYKFWGDASPRPPVIYAPDYYAWLFYNLH